MTGNSEGTGFIGPAAPAVVDDDVGVIDEEALFGDDAGVVGDGDVMATPPPKADLVDNHWTIVEE